VGYLLAGIVVGPNTPGFVADRHIAEQLAEMGIILLMFGVGLHFHVEELLAVRRVAVPGAVVQMFVSTALGTGVGIATGWTLSAAIMFGLCVAFASTVVLTRILSDQNELHSPLGHTAVGWLVVQDLFAVFVLVLSPALFGAGVGAERIAEIIGLAVLKIGALVLVVLVGGGWVIPRLLRHVAATHSRELFTLTVLVVVIGIAVVTNEAFGVSMALGAFLAGMVVGRSEFSLRAGIDALPMRDAFAVLFFVSVGMLFEPGFVLKAPWLFVATLAVVLIGTPVVTFCVMLALGQRVRSALGMGLALAQIGEFSFIVAKLGSAVLKVLPDELINDLVVVAIVSISVNALLNRAAGPIERWAQHRPRLWKLLNSRVRKADKPAQSYTTTQTDPRYRAVVVGYGPVGRTLVRLLRENGIEPTVIELNLETIRQIHTEGLAAVYGDASHAETLRAAGVASAGSLFLTASGMVTTQEVVRLARALNPEVRVLVRAAYLSECPGLVEAGASAVFAAEGELALAMSESLLQELGASPDQIDRERERVRAELLGKAMAPASEQPSNQSPQQDPNVV
jgi:CPA2 family monovalent cation:H+ antiporter-2